MSHVPYKGTANATTDLAGNRLTFMFDVFSTTRSLIEVGQLRAIATTGASRASYLPQVPTVAETFPGYEASVWFGIFGPKEISPEITVLLNAQIRKAISDPELSARLVKDGYTPANGDPQEVAMRIDRDQTRWGNLIKTAGIKPP
jgi:tripartite-type tricarboxylate transporter receptor subunit TctC